MCKIISLFDVLIIGCSNSVIHEIVNTLTYFLWNSNESISNISHFITDIFFWNNMADRNTIRKKIWKYSKHNLLNNKLISVNNRCHGNKKYIYIIFFWLQTRHLMNKMSGNDWIFNRIDASKTEYYLAFWNGHYHNSTSYSKTDS